MRIDRIDLIRYGHFSQRAIDIPQREPDSEIENHSVVKDHFAV